MPTDNTRARNPFPRIVQTTKPRGEVPADSNLAEARGEDLLTPQNFGLTAFNAFSLTSGANSPDDRDPNALYVVNVPDSTQQHVLFSNGDSPAPPLTHMVIQAGFVGTTVLAQLEIAKDAVVGGLGVFPDIAQTFIDPITFPNGELTNPLVRYLDSAYEFENAFRGRLSFEFHASLSIDSGADVPIQWTIQRRFPSPGTWSDFYELADVSYRSTLTPLGVHYKTPTLTHLKNAHYRLKLRRELGPVNIEITIVNPWLKAEVKIQQT